MQPANCLNCNSFLEQDQHYCGQCGQKTNLHRLSFHEVAHDAVHYITHADKSIFRLLKELAGRPGIVAREYVLGRRQKYFKPLNFFLIVAGLVVFMTTLFYTPNDSRSRQMQEAAQHVKDPAKKQHLLKMAERTNKVNMITGKYSNVINMVATPLLTLFFWLIFYRAGYNYVECLVANMYFVGFIMLFYAFLIVTLGHFFPRYAVYFIGAFFIFEIIYRGLAYYQFINRKGRWQAVKAYTASFVITALWVLFTYSLIVRYIKTGFE